MPAAFASRLAHERDTPSCRAKAILTPASTALFNAVVAVVAGGMLGQSRVYEVGKRIHRNAARLGPPCLLNLEIKLVSIECENARPFKELPCENYAFPPM